jgi:integrase
LTGQRPGEIAHLRHEHIKDGWWELPGAPIAGIWPGTKNGQSHRIWLPKPVQSIIASSEAARGYVFPGTRGGPINGLDKVMRAISGRLAVEPVRPHDLRRTFGSLVTRLGFGRPAMDRILNHADHSISSVYDRHSYSAEDRHIMESVAAHVVSLVKGRAKDVKNFFG